MVNSCAGAVVKDAFRKAVIPSVWAKLPFLFKSSETVKKLTNSAASPFCTIQKTLTTTEQLFLIGPG